jgi:hypothetical protein
MDSKAKLADVANDKSALDKITLLEKELSEKTGKKIVLIAYAG